LYSHERMDGGILYNRKGIGMGIELINSGKKMKE
jgi:hypothetical protein